MKTRLLVLLTALAVVAAACGGGDDAAPKKTTTTVEPTTTAPPASTGGGAPLTGLQADPAKLGRPVIVIKVDNAPLGRPQEGINSADIVIEEAVEGGITRLATIWHSNDVPEVGPVRSARSTDINLAAALNKPLFAYAGTNAAFQAQINQAPLVDLSVNRKGAAYYRKGGRKAPYNLWVKMPVLYEESAQAGGPPKPWFNFLAEGESPAGEPANGVSMQYRGRVVTDVKWNWDGAGGVWKRVQNGTDHVDAANQPVAPKNVIVQFVEYINTPYIDRSNEPVPEAKLIGEGEAWVFVGGKVVKGTWKKDAPENPTQFLGPDGQPIKLSPGQTWIELPKPGTATLS